MTESITPKEGFPAADHAKRHANTSRRAETLNRRSQLNTLAANVRRTREEMGMTMDDLAELSGVDHGTITLIETGKITPDFVDVANIAEALNTTTKVLLLRVSTTQSQNREPWQMN